MNAPYVVCTTDGRATVCDEPNVDSFVVIWQTSVRNIMYPWPHAYFTEEDDRNVVHFNPLMITGVSTSVRTSTPKGSREGG